MKKTTKVVFILALIFMIAGFVFCGIGAATGGTWKDFSRMIHDGNFAFSWDWDNDGTTAGESEVYYYDASKVRGLDASVDAGTLTVKKSNNEKVEVRVESNDAEVEIELNDGVLTIEDTDDWHIGFINDYHVEITIALPEGMTLDFVDINVDAGDAVVEAGILTTNRAALNVDAGDLEFNGVINGNLEADCNVGDLEINGTVNGNVEAVCDVGDITIYLTGSEEDYNYRTSCDVGSIEVGDDMSMSGFDKEHTVDNGAVYDMVLSCDVGSITVEFE